jgi:hypothetical protein
MPAPFGSQAIFTAFDLNVKAPNSSTRDSKGLSFLPGIGNKKLHTMMEVEEAMAHFSDHQKKLVREGPCGATWIQRVYKENAGAASEISPLDSISVKRTLMGYTGYCLNTGDGKGGGSGGLYHLCYGVATMTGVRAWLAGCSKEELRNTASVWNEPAASFLRHADWDAIQVPNPGAPTQPAPQQASTAGIHPGVSTHVSSTGILDGGGNKGDKSSANGSSGGQATGSSVFKCQRFGCDENFQSEQDRHVHQQGCEGLANLASDVEDLAETDVESEEE